MSGHRPFGELTEHFTAERRRRVAEKYDELRSILELYESHNNKEHIHRLSVSRLRNYHSGPMLLGGKMSALSLPVRRADRAVTWPANLLHSCKNRRTKNGSGRLRSASVLGERSAPLRRALSSKQHL